MRIVITAYTLRLLCLAINDLINEAREVLRDLAMLLAAFAPFVYMVLR